MDAGIYESIKLRLTDRVYGSGSLLAHLEVDDSGHRLPEDVH